MSAGGRIVTTITSMREVALEYAAAGYRVLPLYTIVQDNDGELVCTCGINCGRSGGKHPIAKLAPNGVRDATTDATVIATWPEQGFNLGVALSEIDMVMDIDDEQIAQALLEKGIERTMSTSTTGRGIHLWLRCPPSKPGTPKLATTKVRIGELRGEGQYVVIPPSRHRYGENYTWPGKQVLVDGPRILQEDPWDWLQRILHSAGFDILPRSATTDVPVPDDLMQIDLPWKTRNQRLKFLLGPDYMYGEDRSGELFHTACEILREAQRLQITLNDKALTGVLWKLDVQRGERDRRGPKFANRSNAAACFWDLATNARATLVQEEARIEEIRQHGEFYYSEEDGFVSLRNPRLPMKVANFEPLILEQTKAWTGDPIVDAEAPYSYVLQFSQAGQQIQIQASADDLSDNRRLESLIRKTCPSGWIVEDWRLFKNGMALYSESFHENGTPQRLIYSAPGWLPKIDAFLLPNVGAITADGILPISYQPPGEASLMSQYGLGVRPAVDQSELEAMLTAVFTVADPKITLPVLMQALQAPMVSLGAGSSAAIVHLRGSTGSYKTSFARLAVSLFGRFHNANRDILETFNNTPNKLQRMLSLPRDLPLIFDDFKTSSISNSVGLTQLIQMYGDRTSRGGLARDGNFRAAAPRPSCILITTGENTWSHDVSTLARTILVDMSTDMINETSLFAIHDQDVETGIIGFEWIRWLASLGQQEVSGRYLLVQRERSSFLKTELEGVHARLIGSIAGLQSAESLFREFVAKKAPGFLKDYLRIAEEGWGHILGGTTDQAKEMEQYSPWETIRNEVVSAIARGEAYLPSVYSNGIPIGSSAGTVVGYHDAEYVILSRADTLGWLAAHQLRQGTRLTFDWQSFVSSAKRDHGAIQPETAQRIFGTRVRRLHVPKAEFFKDVQLSGYFQMGEQLN